MYAASPWASARTCEDLAPLSAVVWVSVLAANGCGLAAFASLEGRHGSNHPTPLERHPHAPRAAPTPQRPSRPSRPSPPAPQPRASAPALLRRWAHQRALRNPVPNKLRQRALRHLEPHAILSASHGLGSHPMACCALPRPQTPGLPQRGGRPPHAGPYEQGSKAKFFVSFVICLITTHIRLNHNAGPVLVDGVGLTIPTV